MFCLHLQYQGASAMGMGQFAVPLFDAKAFLGATVDATANFRGLHLPFFDGWVHHYCDSIFVDMCFLNMLCQIMLDFWASYLSVTVLYCCYIKYDIQPHLFCYQIALSWVSAEISVQAS